MNKGAHQLKVMAPYRLYAGAVVAASLVTLVLPFATRLTQYVAAHERPGE